MELLNSYVVQDMREWGDEVDADLAIIDPPFGIDFDGKQSNYNRDTGNVVDGYVEWPEDKYRSAVSDMLDVCERNLGVDGQMLIFSGWNNSYKIHDELLGHDELRLEGKQYWRYNFAPYCTRRPAHNVYEIYWAVKSDDWYYTNECSYDHCTEGEANLSVMNINRNYLKEMPKYSTRMTPEVIEVLLEHYTEEGDTVFNPMAGSGTVGIAAERLNRNFVLGDANAEAKEVYEVTKKRLAE
jgi:DNA modification methylase